MVRNDGNNSVRLRASWAASAVLLLLVCLWTNHALAEEAFPTKPRTIVTTDGESDVKCSSVRFLLYTTDFDIAALIYTNSRWHPNGNGTRWMHDFIDEYARLHRNLLVHHPDYPTPESLKSLICVGQMDRVGKAGVGGGHDTPGSDRIVEVLLDHDDRPVWLQAWGGLSNICQALCGVSHTRFSFKS